MKQTILFWHRRDLRFSDNLGLYAASQQNPRLVGVFCLDPGILAREDLAPVRLAYLLECLPELARRYRDAGGRLVLLRGAPQERIPALAQALHAASVFWNEDVEPYSRRRDTEVEQVLRASGTGVCRFWDQLLHSPQELYTGSGQAYQVFGPFWRKWIRLPKPKPVGEPRGLESLLPSEWRAAQGEIPEMLDPQTDCRSIRRQAGLNWKGDLPAAPGEAASRQMLHEFMENRIASYHTQRNFPAVAGTSGLSAAFHLGVLGIRTAWAASCRAERQSFSAGASEGVQTWQQELCWREFYQHALWHFPGLADGAFRPGWDRFPWENREDLFHAWTRGETGFPMVDAAMRQLNSTGWMHNRCRMIVAAFLTKDLCIDWRWGEKYFMRHLADGDLAANNGGWQWSASSGMDPKPLRIFNPCLQAGKYDPRGDYIRTYLPELGAVDASLLISGNIPAGQRGNYPPPVVSHAQRQAEFRALYARWKSKLAPGVPGLSMA